MIIFLKKVFQNIGPLLKLFWTALVKILFWLDYIRFCNYINLKKKQNIMKTLFYFLISCILLSILASSNSSLAESNPSDDLLPCCNNIDPKTSTGPTWSFYCSSGEIEIDSICCVNLWNHFQGPPSPTLPCTVVGLHCNEALH